MDLDRLTLNEVAQMSKLIELLGTPELPDDLRSTINVLEGATTLYRKKLQAAEDAARYHGE